MENMKTESLKEYRYIYSSFSDYFHLFRERFSVMDGVHAVASVFTPDDLIYKSSVIHLGRSGSICDWNPSARHTLANVLQTDSYKGVAHGAEAFRPQDAVL